MVADSAEQAEYLRQLARLVEGQLHDLARARRAWEQLLDLLPTDGESLDALARIAHAESDWPTLVRIMERQMPLAEEPGRAADIGLQRAEIFDEKLHDTDAAALALEQLVSRDRPAQRRRARAPAHLLRETTRTGRGWSRWRSASCS